MNIEREKISFVIPIDVTESQNGTPVLVYETINGSNKLDISFGIYLIGIYADKNYVAQIQVSCGDEKIIPFESKEYFNKRSFTVSESNDGEKIVSASLKVTFKDIDTSCIGICKVEARLYDGKNNSILDEKHSYFDIKPYGMVRNEFR